MKENTLITVLLVYVVYLAVIGSSYRLGAYDPKSAGNTPVSFNCEFSDQGQMPCTPLGNAITAYKAQGSEEPIYSAMTNESNFGKGVLGDSLHFTSYLGEYIGIRNNSIFKLPSFSVSFWIKEPSWFESNSPVISNINSEETAGWKFNAIDDAKKLKFGVGTTNGLVGPPPVEISTVRFNHIVGTFDGSNVILYKDGLPSGNIRINGTYNPDPQVSLRLGLDSFDTQNSWAGSLDDLLIYNRAISPEEVKRIYSNSTAVSNGLVGHWPFDGNLSDVSGNENNAAMNFQISSMIFSPDGRMFFSEKRTGEVRIMKADHVLSEPFVRLSDLFIGDHEGLLGITLDPDFETNHYLYLYFTRVDNSTGTVSNSLVRFTDENDKATNMTTIMANIPADSGGYYSGGALAFGKDNKLYITVGVGSHPELAQNSSSLFGKVLRINKDGSIPQDNPFPGSPVYTLGNKNPYGIAFDNRGLGLLSDNGYEHYDEINILKAGGNYGFPKYQVPTSTSLQSHYIFPIRSYYDVVAPTQAIFYTGTKYPGLEGNFIVGSYNSRNADPLHALTIGNDNNSITEKVITFTNFPKDNIISVAESPSGDLYFAGYNIYKLKSIDLAKQQIVFPINVVTTGVNITDISVSQSHGTISVGYDNASITRDRANKVQLEIPKNLLDGITSVSTGDSEHLSRRMSNNVGAGVTFELQSKSLSTSVTVNIQQPTAKLVIHGTRVLSHLIHSDE